MNSTEDTFESILSAFKKRLTPKEVENFQFVTLHDVRQTAIRIQKEQEQKKMMVNMARIESFLEAMDQFGKVIEVFLNASSFIAFVWGPVKFILQTASTWVDTFETLIDAYGQIGQHMPLLIQHKELFGVNPHMRRLLALMYDDILMFHRRAIRFFGGKATVWHQLFRSIWKDFDTQFKQILAGLSQHRQLIIEQAQLLHFQQSQIDSQANLLHIQQYEQDRSERIMRLKKQEKVEEDKKYLAVLEWFSGAGSTVLDHDTFRSIRSEYAGSGDWILKDEKVQNWMETDIPESSILWIHGIPGAGKTILASAIIDACMRDQTRATSYFYCNENDPKKNDGISVYRGLLSQVLNQCRELVQYCYDKIVSSGEVMLTTTSLAEQLLKLFCERIARQYIIIDGLDECENKQRMLLLKFFMATVDGCDERDPGKLRVLFVSQESADIAKALRTTTVFRLTAEDNKNDIKAYVRDWSAKIKKKYSLENDTVEYIQESTCIRSQGMFLFAKLVVENLYAQETQENLLKEVKVYGLPKGIGEAYERIISRMKRSMRDAKWKTACKLLGWMVCARRPLKWCEIQAAVSINPDNQSMEFDKRKLRSHIQDYCGSLIQVLRGDRIELVHTTAKMHITRSGHVRKSTVECNLAAICLRYLTFECFSSDVDPEKLQQFAFEGSLSFQDYAVAKWLEHIRAIVQTKLDDFFMDADSQDAFQELEIALEEFVDFYEGDLLHESILDVAQQDCNPFKKYPFYEKLLPVWNHVHRHYGKGPTARNDVSIKALGDVLSRNRNLLEDSPPPNRSSSSSAGNSDDQTTFYDDRRFKCPKVTCFYFHEGFEDAKSRKQHIKRHDRPFSCPFPDCSIAEFGFVSNKGLDKHRRLFHPEIEDEATSFTAAPGPTVASTWECRLCGKKFTRGFHMRNHMNAHSGSRPHACSECGKAFTRANDCKRHEKIHARR